MGSCGSGGGEGEQTVRRKKRKRRRRQKFFVIFLSLTGRRSHPKSPGKTFFYKTHNPLPPSSLSLIRSHPCFLFCLALSSSSSSSCLLSAHHFSTTLQERKLGQWLGGWLVAGWRRWSKVGLLFFFPITVPVQGGGDGGGIFLVTKYATCRLISNFCNPRKTPGFTENQFGR